MIKDWVDKAEEDLQAAVDLLKNSQSSAAVICFLTQQCTEKYLKAKLVMEGTSFPKTHDIENLIGLLPHGVALTLSIQEQRRLTTYAVLTRYPGTYAPLTRSDAVDAVKIARRVRKEIRRLLPKQALRKRAR